MTDSSLSPEVIAAAARRLLPWFFWAQIVPVLVWPMPHAAPLASLAVVTVAAWLITRSPALFQASLLIRRPQGDWVPLTMVLLLPIMLWPRLLTLPFNLIWPNTGTSDYPGPGWMLAIIVILLVPLLEELVYRGLLLRAFESWGRLPAILASSLLFGLGHGPVQFLGTAAFGWVLGWLAWEYRSIWPGVILHAAFNLSAGVIYLAALRAGEDGSGLLVVGLLSVIMLIGGISMTVKARRPLASIMVSPWQEDGSLGSLHHRLVAILRLWPVSAGVVLAAIGWWSLAVG